MPLSEILQNRISIFLCLLVLFVGFQAEVSANTKNKKKTASSNSKSKLWREITENDFSVKGQRLLTPAKYRIFQLNQPSLINLVSDLPFVHLPIRQMNER